MTFNKGDKSEGVEIVSDPIGWADKVLLGLEKEADLFNDLFIFLTDKNYYKNLLPGFRL